MYSLLVTVLALPTLLISASPLNNIDARELVNGLSSPLHLRSGVVELKIGVKKMNVGYNPSATLDKAVQEALRGACFEVDRQSCGPNVKRKFSVDVRKQRQLKSGTWENYLDREDMYVTVDSAQWHGNKVIYDLLVRAVASAADHAAWGTGSCEQFAVDQGEELNLEMFNFCNTADRISVSIPGGNWMNVRFKSSSEFGNYDCGKIKNTAEGYLSKDLLPEIRKAVGDEDLFVLPTCLYSLDR
ncbi:hypothetical protein BDU57DRAFT_580194 [Ampelomyces quisqualis]|uniref:Uncharacterized protein n=1 Tax=Ampelomyces quisqualis TaxID=50730 RepID=A0A6A5QDK8_AMPQU|nr:hypothetical protein BDU57DRAFT_580194 [Ampelomyces quisqualis]